MNIGEYLKGITNIFVKKFIHSCHCNGDFCFLFLLFADFGDEFVFSCTDICFEFNAVGRPAKSVHFDIYENKDYKLPKFLEGAEELKEQQALPGVMELVDDDDYVDDPRELNYKGENLKFLAAAVDYEFAEKDLQVLLDLLTGRGLYDRMEQFKYLRSKYNYLASMAAKKPIPNRLAYLKGAVMNDWG